MSKSKHVPVVSGVFRREIESSDDEKSRKENIAPVMVYYGSQSGRFSFNF